MGALYSHGARVTAGEDSVTVYTMEGAGPIVGFEYDFHADLSPRVVRFSGSYPIQHKAFEKSRQIDHSWDNCQERKRPVKLKRWEPATGWRQIEIPWAV